ncbi:RNA dependent RNA polymerase-domain-containing protein [Aspergillus cavernicola]|uniref:RNA-dependent RNA polymerase n=1 Tax=Aspergillus cavernicola TaxID=176166 RepID=A0ABR4ITV4_9EURO
MRGPRDRPGPAPHHLPQQIMAPWKSWESVAVNISNISEEMSTLDLWQAFKKEGTVFSIDIFEDSHGNRKSRAKIRFRPPPSTDFWRRGTYLIARHDGKSISIFVSLENRPPEWDVPSPVRAGVNYPAEVKIPISSMNIGVLVNKTTMMPMRTVVTSAKEPAFLVLNLRRKDLLVYFRLPLSGAGQPGRWLPQEYRLRIPFSQLDRIFQTRDPLTGNVSHFSFLNSPPIYHRRIRNIENSFVEETSWRESDTWFRQAHIAHNPQELATLPVSLRRQSPIIDIGRWNAFRITYPNSSNDKGDFRLFCDILSDYNLVVEESDRYTLCDKINERPIPIWKWIDLDIKTSGTSYTSLQDLLDPDHVHLPFAVRYQLEVCISHGFLSEFNMSQAFALKLAELEETQATKLLEHVALQKKVYYNPMDIFDLKFVKGVTTAKIPSYCCHMRSARITPSTVYFNVPSVDISNRVIRHYINLADNFLRVRFTDEKHLGRIHATADNTMDEVFTRVKRALANGIMIGNTRYDFLAFGNSQFREHGAYFFAPKDGITAANIRAWMGQFSHIRNIAKHAARLGQCFSTTRAIAGCSVNVKKIDDITRSGYTFSDGVGRISQFLAQIAMSELKVKTPNGEPPSAYQFRLGGCKGMLIVSPEAHRQDVHIRESQYKFAALHRGLEIIRWSQLSVATLNRQLILVLSTLGVTDEVFHLKLNTMLKNLNEAMGSDPKAVCLLKKYVDPNQVTLTVSQMVLDGFRRSNEPFMTSIMTLWRTWHLKYLKEKAKIVIDKGACLLGCMDETSDLKGHFYDKVPKKAATIEEKIAALPEIFAQVYRPGDGGKYEIIEGLCILARNPSLHPGDIRVVRAVNAPRLKHLKDVVVLPQTGDRDVASMCSGGDLDGDDYLVIWDQDLLPVDWFQEPMNYTSKKAHDLDHDVTVDEITSFFVTYMKNDCLPTIAHAHLAWGDYLEDGVNEAKCIQLAQLHSDAVDYNKTGNPATMTRSLRPRKWPHFMEKNNKPEHCLYRSEKVLGQLYDAVERSDFVPSLEMNFDKRILDCHVEVTEDMYSFARSLKIEYDTAMRRIMAQHEIKTEFEVWSTFVLRHSNMTNDYKFHEDMGTISSALLEDFRKRFYDKVGGRSFELLAPSVVVMYRITHEEMSAALAKHREENPIDDDLFISKPAPKIEQLPLISFPWIFPKILGRIAVGLYDQADTATTHANLASLDLNQASEGNLENTELDAHSGGSNDASLPTQTMQSNPRDQPDNNPFGLNLDDEASTTTSMVSNNMPRNYDNIDSLEKLLGFGPLNPPSTPSSSLIFPLGSVKEECLLDFDREPINSKWVATPGIAAPVLKEDQPMKENQPINEWRGKQSRVVEMVEEESERGDDTSGVDRLKQLAGF